MCFSFREKLVDLFNRSATTGKRTLLRNCKNISVQVRCQHRSRVSSTLKSRENPGDKVEVDEVEYDVRRLFLRNLEI